MDGQVRLVVPELFFIELANALRYNSRFTAHDVEAAVASVWAMELERADLTSEALKKAVRLAYQHQITLYDASFLALAQADQAVLVTADEAFCRKVLDPSHVLLLKHLPQE
jgi:predicted nucleic acid-binding protein